MSLLDLIRVRRSGGVATLTVATSATHEAHKAVKLSIHPPTVATVATVTVANPPQPKVGAHDRKCPMGALLVLQRLHGEHRARLIDRPGAIARVRLDHWRDAQKATFGVIVDIARDLHEQGVIVLEHSYARPTGAHPHACQCPTNHMRTKP